MQPLPRLAPLSLLIGLSLLQCAHAETPAADANDFTSATDDYHFSTADTTVLDASKTANTIRYTGTGGTINLSTTAVTQNLTVRGILNAGTGTLTIQRTHGTGTLVNAKELVINTENADIDISAPISGAGTLTKTGAGTLTLSNINTYTGGTTVNGGILALTAVAADIGRIRGTLNIETGGEVQINQWALGNSDTSAAKNVTILNINGGILNKTDTENNGGIHGAIINMTGGEIKGSSCVVSNNAGDHAVLNTRASASAATISAGIQMHANGGQAGGIMDFTIADGAVATDLLISGPLTQNGPNTQSITKAGAGTMALSGDNSYTGTTTISAGKLLINGNSSLATGAATVARGATLGGTGTMGGAVTVSGTLAPGDGIQSLVGGMTTFNGYSTFAVELDSNAMLGTEADLLVVNGDLKLQGPVELRLTETADSPVAYPLGKVFSLVNYTGSLHRDAKNGFTANGKLLANGAKFTAGPNTWQITYDSTSGGDNFTEDQLKGRFINITTVSADISIGTFVKFAAIVMAIAHLIALGVLGVHLKRRAAAKPA